MKRSLLAFCLLVPFAAQTQTAVPRCPNILVVFDSSGSMSTNTTNATGGTDSRYNVGKAAVKQVTAAGQSQFRYGIELFGTNDVGPNGPTGCGVSAFTCSYPTPATCKSVTCDYNTAGSIASVLDSFGAPQGATPTGSSINEASKRPDMNDTQRSRYILLVTDGEPSSCTTATPSGTTDPLTFTIESLNAIRTTKSVKTFVLAFNVPLASQAKLNQMAQAGGTARNTTCDGANPCFYSAANGTELQNALNAIISQVSGEFGGVTCDDSCYGQGCAANQFCTGLGDGGADCKADLCVGKTCATGSACVEGVCKAFCNTTCKSDERCDNGACVKDVACTPNCSGLNTVCVNGQCVEDFCSGKSFNLVSKCPPTHFCYRNACQLQFQVPDSGSGGGAGGGSDGGAGGGGGGSKTPPGAGCCSEAPGAFSALAIAALLATLALRRRVAVQVRNRRD
jgi:hypothetical protein